MTEQEALSVLRAADPVRAASAAAALWEMWHRSGQPDLDALLRQGIDAMEAQQLAEAEKLFSRLIEIAPAFAEGWNKRATVRYLAKDYVGSIADCRETLRAIRTISARSPDKRSATSRSRSTGRRPSSAGARSPCIRIWTAPARISGPPCRSS